MKKLVKFLSLATIVSLGLMGCGGNETQNTSTTAEVKKLNWKLVTSWPKNFPGLGTAPENFAKLVNEMSGGRLTIKVYGAGEIVPGFQVFDAVSQGTAEMGHAASYYWKGKMPAAPIFTATPFGLNAQETNGWIHYGGGLELWRELYEPFGVIPFAGGNTGVQSAGWFKREINKVDDLKGLKMRIPGLGGEVLQKLGGVPVALTGGEIFTSLQSGAIDATEWVGPYNDLAFGFHKVAEHYYVAGWHEPGAMLEFTVNQKAFNALPKDLQAIVEVATRAVNQDMLDEYTVRNNAALEQLQNKHNVELKTFPRDVMLALKNASKEVIEEQKANDPTFNKIMNSYQAFQKQVTQYHNLSELEYYNNRNQ
ncbi:TRAP transporter substrate-binding protein [Psychrosphaera haliotis]|uniref:ABC transporter substrate-binding protein n=1 Tax=Psychrosphaera haliotis TaxID=555083 RepID=A0A6N8F8Y7_9GAMM|nr:TRAP transporter substrate-binding protein DctP [Psychrosphaera haliotis]MUH73055.1 ABC transporter substrate-binding protein [Psychrosphaera haliotis]